jgi:uncharacterized protein (TIGR03067 family)
MHLFLLPILTSGLMLGADAARENPAQKDLEKFQGDWVIVSYTVDGKAATPEELATIKLTVKGPRSTFQRDGNTYHGTYTLDTNRQPNAIDILHADGPNKGKVILGIYEFGDDQLTACLACPGAKERPREMASKAGSGHVLEVWKRVR